MFSRRTEEQQRQPTPLGIHSHVIHLLAHRLEAAQVMVRLEQSLKMSALLGVGYQHNPSLLQKRLISG